MISSIALKFQQENIKKTSFDYSKDFLAFVVDTHKKVYGQTFIVKKFHYEICEMFYNCAMRKSDNYINILNMPPRFSKTQIAIYYICWCLLNNWSAKFLYVSYSDELSLKVSRESKIILSNIYGMKSKIAKTSDGLWETDRMGAFLATSILGQATGFGAGDMQATNWSGDILIDDPQKPADSFYERKRSIVQKAFDETFWSRRNNQDKIPIIVLQQRVHEDDLSGYLLKSSYAKTHIKIAALDSLGESIFPEKISTATLLGFKNVNEYAFNAQQMQAPKKLEGNFFDISKLEEIQKFEFARIANQCRFFVRSWDLAGISSSSRSKAQEDLLDRDWTRGILLAVFSDFLVIVKMDSVRGLVEQNDILIDETAEQDGADTAIVFPLDPAVGGEHYASYLENLRNVKNKTVKFIRPTGSKIVRAQPTKSLINLGKIKILSDESSKFDSWQSVLLAELVSFPFGKHDDCVDALTQAVQFIQDQFPIANLDGMLDFYTEMVGY